MYGGGQFPSEILISHSYIYNLRQLLTNACMVGHGSRDGAKLTFADLCLYECRFIFMRV